MCYKRPFVAAFDADAHFANVTGWCELAILFAIDLPNARIAPPQFGRSLRWCFA